MLFFLQNTNVHGERMKNEIKHDLDNNNLIIVDSSALPDVFIKVLEAKRLLESGRAVTIAEAAAATGISRSAFYKYRNLVFPFYENSRGRTITFAMNLENVPGLLSNLLNVVASFGANILTINQTIPINGTANVTITIETGTREPAELFGSLKSIAGVLSFKLLGRE